MGDNRALKNGFGQTLLQGLLAWIAATTVLLIIASLLIAKEKIPYPAVGYLCSLLSFLAAVFAGAHVERAGRGGLLSATILAGFLVIVLLTFGYMVGGKEMAPSGIISVVSFTISGCLLGSVLLGRGKGKGKKSAWNPKRKK